MWDILVAGILGGSLYALAGLGLVIIYRTSEVVNFSQGDMATILTFVGYVLLVKFAVPYIIAILIVLVMAFLFGYVINRTLIRSIEKSSVLTIVIATLGLSLILNGITGIVWGFDTKSMPALLSNWSWTIGGVAITGSQLSAAIVAYLLIAGLIVFFHKSKYGLALRAVNQNPMAASFMGVNVGMMNAISWGIAGGMGGVAGLLITPSLYLDPNVLDNIMVTAFAVVVLGGFSSVTGVILGGILLGVVDNVIAVYISSQLESVFTFLIILFVLWIRPQGLLGGTVIRKF